MLTSQSSPHSKLIITHLSHTPFILCSLLIPPLFPYMVRASYFRRRGAARSLLPRAESSNSGSVSAASLASARVPLVSFTRCGRDTRLWVSPESLHELSVTHTWPGRRSEAMGDEWIWTLDCNINAFWSDLFQHSRFLKGLNECTMFSVYVAYINT